MDLPRRGTARMAHREPRVRRLRSAARLVAALYAIVAAALLCIASPASAGIPAAYAPMVVEPSIVDGRSEFDLNPAIARAKREHKRLYVYLGASDCPYCRRYEQFLNHYSSDLVAPFNIRVRSTASYWLLYPDVVVDLAAFLLFRDWLMKELALAEAE
jgi:thiol-disulfide isomerase/thioredoxin